MTYASVASIAWAGNRNMRGYVMNGGFCNLLPKNPRRKHAHGRNAIALEKARADYVKAHAYSVYNRESGKFIRGNLTIEEARNLVESLRRDFMVDACMREGKVKA